MAQACSLLAGLYLWHRPFGLFGLAGASGRGYSLFLSCVSISIKKVFFLTIQDPYTIKTIYGGSRKHLQVLQVRGVRIVSKPGLEHSGNYHVTGVVFPPRAMPRSRQVESKPEIGTMVRVAETWCYRAARAVVSKTSRLEKVLDIAQPSMVYFLYRLKQSQLERNQNS